jgi:DNA invertase Pin-like site-specific DNA recombinase
MDSLTFIAKTRIELAIEYGISVKTFSRWIRKAKIELPSGLIDPYHLRIIYGTFGIPANTRT